GIAAPRYQSLHGRRYKSKARDRDGNGSEEAEQKRPASLKGSPGPNPDRNGTQPGKSQDHEQSTNQHEANLLHAALGQAAIKDTLNQHQNEAHVSKNQNALSLAIKQDILRQQGQRQ